MSSAQECFNSGNDMLDRAYAIDDTAARVQGTSQALQMFVKGVNQFNDCNCYLKLEDVLFWDIYATEEEAWSANGLTAAAANGGQDADSGTLFFLGMLKKALSEVPPGENDFINRAAHAGHCFAQFTVAEEFGLAKDEGRKWLELSADGGCALAWSGLAYVYKEGRGVPRDLHVAVKNYTRATLLGDDCSHLTEELTRDHAEDIAPWGRWNPSAETHQWVPDRVHRAMLTWMLISKQLPIPRHIDLMVAFFVCSANVWKKAGSSTVEKTYHAI